MEHEHFKGKRGAATEVRKEPGECNILKRAETKECYEVNVLPTEIYV